MSQYINEIIKDIRTNPQSWKRYNNDGLQKGDIVIDNTGNGHKLYFGWLGSVVNVKIKGKDSWGLLTQRDKYRLEEAFLWWIRNSTLARMQT